MRSNRWLRFPASPKPENLSSSRSPDTRPFLPPAFPGSPLRERERRHAMSCPSHVSKDAAQSSELDRDVLIRGCTLALHAHLVANSRAPAAAGPDRLSVFKERVPGADAAAAAAAARATNVGIPTGVATAVEEFLKCVYVRLALEPEVLVLSIVLIERLQLASRAPVLSVDNIRFVIATAVILACKLRYDQRVFVSDFADHVCGNRAHLKQLLECESVFLTTLGYNLWVSTATFDKYHASLCALTRRFTPVANKPPPAPCFDSHAEELARAGEAQAAVSDCPTTETAKASASASVTVATGHASPHNTLRPLCKRRKCDSVVGGLDSLASTRVSSDSNLRGAAGNEYGSCNNLATAASPASTADAGSHLVNVDDLGPPAATTR
mmetsp:Transcript_9704/g.23418  ORF Transcript_9704/g.23418 Transcript_9704/m.23418 type:complete len:382 (-) Transcript_9704:317-1462(-)